MWIVEINVLGRRCTHEVHARRPSLVFRPRAVQTRLAQLRQLRAAA